MSGSIALSSEPFTDAEKTDIRRFCGYPAYGVGVTGFQSWRFFQAYGLLEYRMNNFSPAEIQVVRQYLGNLYVLEAAVLTAGTNMGTDVAAVWTRNKDEARDREKLLDEWRRRLAGFMGVPAGPALSETGGLRVVV